MPSNLNEFGQPLNKAFNFKRNTSKAFEGLLGIISGLKADMEITDGDVMFLQNWLSEQDYLKHDPDVVDLIYLLNDILEDGVITQQEKDDLNSFLSDILEYRDEWEFYDIQKDDFLKRLTGILYGLTADNHLTSEEILHLKAFIDSFEEFKNLWPVNNIYNAIQESLEDGFLSGAELESILLILNNFLGGNIQDDGASTGKTIKLPTDVVSNIQFKDKSFCFTGAISLYTRKECEQLVYLRGGYVHKGVTKELDFLVIGGISSRDWIQASFGRKIEKAMKYREEFGSSIKIIKEEDWAKHLI